MFKLIEANEEHQYKVYQSDVIIKHQKEMLHTLHESHNMILNHYFHLNKTSTWLYRTYNIFCLVGASKHFFDLYQDLTNIIKLNLPDEKYIWFQSWLNYHKANEVLDWHTHSWCYHGYICIDPKKSRTVFKDYSITNELGNIYIGPGHRDHKVEVLEPFNDERITLGFDITLKEDGPTDLLSLIPIV